MYRNFYVNLKNGFCVNVFKQITLILIFGIAITALAAPGDLDTSFNGTGKSRVGFGGGDDVAYAVAVQSDGKPVVAGASKDGSLYELSIIRYNTDGTPDASFGSGGKVLLHTNSGASAVKIQSDGKIVVAASDFTVLRFNTDGSLDASFGAGGIVTTDFGAGSFANANTLAIQTDGKIVVAGKAQIVNPGFPQVAVARYNTNGTLDTTFDFDGKVTTDVTASSDEGKAVVIQSDGKILIAGNSGGCNGTITLVRYNSNGSLDTTFDGDGKVVAPGSGICMSSGLAIQKGGTIVQTQDKIIVAGGGPFSGQIFIFSYNLDGTLNTSFGTGGQVTTSKPNAFLFANSVTTQPGGTVPSRIIVAGSIDFGSGDKQVTVIRYNFGGSLSTMFGNGGEANIPVGTSSTGNAIDFSGGKFVIVGSTLASANNDDFAVVRLDSNGFTDGTFYDQGVRTDDLGNSDKTHASSTAIQSDGKIVVAGSIQNLAGDYDFTVVRYNANGSLDASLDGDGKVTTAFAANSNDYANAVAIQSDGNIVAAGVSSSSFALARYNSDGSLDTSFSFDGKVTTPVGDANLHALAIQTDGKIVVAGYINNGANKDFAVFRYNTNGSLDTTFDGDGKVTTPVGASDDEANAIAIQADGKIIVAGYSINGTNKDFAVVRYNTNGSLDTSFNLSGKVTTPIGTDNDVGNAVAIQADGKIVVAGSSIYLNNGVDNNFALVRYNSNGSLDTSFDGDGKLTTSVSDLDSVANALAIQPNGKILAAGYAISTGTFYDFAVVRYNTNGSLDNLYGSGGKVVTDVSGGLDIAYGLALDSTGRAFVTGDAGGLFGIVRLLGDTPLSQTYEGDVQSRPLGDGFVDSDDIQQIRRFSVGNNLPYQSNEFQRADCSPRSTSGDGFVDGDDVQQARRFSVGTDSNQVAGGPTSIPPPTDSDWLNNEITLPFGKQTVRSSDRVLVAPAAFRVDAQNTSAGATLTVPIRVDTVGNEVGYTFSIAFDATKLTSPTAAIGSAGGDVIFNANNAGQIGFSVTSFSGGTIAAANNVALVNVTFTVAAGATAGTTPITFTDTPARRKASGTDPNNPITQPTYAAGTITIGGGTAAGAIVSGRVLTADDTGLTNAVVTLTDKNGATRTARTTTFGYYRFSDVETGQTYVAAVQSKRYQFASQVVNVTDNLSELNFYSTGEVLR